MAVILYFLLSLQLEVAAVGKEDLMLLENLEDLEEVEAGPRALEDLPHLVRVILEESAPAEVRMAVAVAVELELLEIMLVQLEVKVETE